MILDSSFFERARLYKIRLQNKRRANLSTGLLGTEVKWQVFLSLVVLSKSGSLLRSKNSQHSSDRLAHNRAGQLAYKKILWVKVHSGELGGTSTCDFLDSEGGEFLFELFELFSEVGF